MQETVVALSQEVEYLSNINMQFLEDLKKKDGFYETYRQTVEELEKLREAHGVLITMIRNHHLTVDETVLDSDNESEIPSDMNKRRQSPNGTLLKNTRSSDSDTNFKSFISCGVFGEKSTPQTHRVEAPIRNPRRNKEAQLFLTQSSEKPIETSLQNNSVVFIPHQKTSQRVIKRSNKGPVAYDLVRRVCSSKNL